jgi:multidrug transporter EmrE-like cation transporter
MSPLPPSPPSRAQLALSAVGLLCVVVSLVLAFNQPFGLWHWLLLLVAVACIVASRRLGR